MFKPIFDWKIFIGLELIGSRKIKNESRKWNVRRQQHPDRDPERTRRNSGPSRGLLVRSIAASAGLFATSVRKFRWQFRRHKQVWTSCEYVFFDPVVRAKCTLEFELVNWSVGKLIASAFMRSQAGSQVWASADSSTRSINLTAASVGIKLRPT